MKVSDFIVLIVYCTCVPQFCTASGTETNIYQQMGSTVLLRCSDENRDSIKKWMGPYANDTVIYFLGLEMNTDLPDILTSRIQLAINFTQGDLEYDLQLDDISKTDEGVYSCFIEDFHEPAYVFYLYLLEPPTDVIVGGQTLSNKLLGTEGKDLTLNCTALGGQPKSEMWWIFHDKILNHSESGAVLYIIKNITRDYHLTMMICQAKNPAVRNPITKRIRIYISYPPVVEVRPTMTAGRVDKVTLTCDAYGNPSNYTYRWTQYSFNDEFIREIDTGSKQLTLSSKEMNSRSGLRYTDSGKYVCMVSNGVLDKYGQRSQNGSGFVIIHTWPIFILVADFSVTQYAHLGKTGHICVYVRSIPKFHAVRWYYQTTNSKEQRRRRRRTQKKLNRLDWHLITESVKCRISDSETVVFDSVQNVNMEAFELTLTISNVTMDDFTEYKISIVNYYGIAEKTFELNPSGVPETPRVFKILSNSRNSFTLLWVPAFNGGHSQGFFVEYRLLNTTSWYRVRIPETSKDNNDKELTYELDGLSPLTDYEVRLVAHNIQGDSEPTDKLVNTTMHKPIKSQQHYGPMIGGALGGVLGSVLIVGFTTFFLRLRRRSPRGNLRMTGTVSTSDHQNNAAAMQKDTLCDISSIQNDIVININEAGKFHNHEHKE